MVLLGWLSYSNFFLFFFQGFGYIEYGSEESVKAALCHHGEMVCGCCCCCYLLF